MRVRVRPVAGEADLEQVCRLRYAVYIDGAGFRLGEADHTRRVIRDPLDDWGSVFVAESKATGEMLGTVRLNLAWRGSLDPQCVDELGMEEFGAYFPARAALVSRFAVLPDQRRGRTPWALLEAVFAAQVDARVAFSFATCRPERRAWCLERLGYFQVFPDFRHPTDGTHHPLVLPLEDAGHLERVGSPLRRLVSRSGGGESVAYFRTRFGSSARDSSVARLGAEQLLEHQ